MGAGKTTVGRLLARQMEREFFDSDGELEKRTGVSICTIFEYEGEDKFRERESSVIESLMEEENIVLATGGGAVLKDENRLILSQGVVVFLSISVQQQIERTKMNRNRPLLQEQKDLSGYLTDLHQQREPIYQSLANLSIDVGGLTKQSVVNKIFEFLSA